MNPTFVLSVDSKKNRIRIHKAMLHMLGDPTYIQLLVNPADMVVGIRCVDIPLSGEPVHKITERRMRSDNSYEIYSQSFLEKLRELVPSMNNGCVYRIRGEVFSAKQMAVFFLKTLQPIKR